MRRTEQVQGLRLMKFEEVYGRTHRGGLRAMSLSLLKFVGQASLVDDAMLPS